MEAENFRIKKQIKKGKSKKTSRNVICRPDPTYWPQTSAEEGKTLIEELNMLKVDIPPFKKPQWSEMNQYSKQSRARPSPARKIEGLLFGIMECRKAIEKKECAGVLIESGLNPKIIVRPLIDVCFDKSIPVLCLKELKNATKANFDIASSVLGVKKNCLMNLERKILDISKFHKHPETHTTMIIDDDTDTNDSEDIECEIISCPYLFNNYTRHYNDDDIITVPNVEENQATESKTYVKMDVKKTSGNPNRNET